MLPEIVVHRPRGFLPRLVVRKRTVLEYQPSWLLLALPVLAVPVRARYKSPRRPAAPQLTVAQDAADLVAHERRRRPVRVVLVSVVRRRSPPAATAGKDVPMRAAPPAG